MNARDGTGALGIPSTAMSELPGFQDFMRPLLDLLEREAQPLRSRDAYEKLADTLKLDEVARAQLLPSGKQPTYRNRIGWASTYLRFAGLLHAPSRGVWAITPAGRAFLAKHVGRIDLRVLETIPAYVEARAAAESDDDDIAVPGSATTAPIHTPLDLTPPAENTPEEQLFAAHKHIVASVADELAKLLQKTEPAFFEEMVIELLGKMGYGTSDDARIRVGRSGDGGIDGIISLDKLGLEKALSSKTRHPGEALVKCGARDARFVAASSDITSVALRSRRSFERCSSSGRAFADPSARKTTGRSADCSESSAMPVASSMLMTSTSVSSAAPISSASSAASSDGRAAPTTIHAPSAS